MWITCGKLLPAAVLFTRKACYLCEKIENYNPTTMKDDIHTPEAEAKIAGLEACITQLRNEHERQLAISRRDQLEKQMMKREIEVLKGELEGLRIVQSASRRAASVDVAPDNEVSAAPQTEVRQRIYGEVIEKLITEAEQYPSNQNDKAEAIKSAIQSLILADSVQLTAALRTRLQNLGRKEATMARAMVEVTGNDKVIFGGQGNG